MSHDYAMVVTTAQHDAPEEHTMREIRNFFSYTGPVVILALFALVIFTASTVAFSVSLFVAGLILEGVLSAALAVVLGFFTWTVAVDSI